MQSVFPASHSNMVIHAAAIEATFLLMTACLTPDKLLFRSSVGSLLPQHFVLGQHQSTWPPRFSHPRSVIPLQHLASVCFSTQAGTHFNVAWSRKDVQAHPWLLDSQTAEMEGLMSSSIETCLVAKTIQVPKGNRGVRIA